MIYSRETRPVVRRSFAIGLSLAICGIGQVSAQEQPVLQEVVVTGTRIRTTDQGELPVQTITQQQIQQSGAANAEQLLQTVSIAVQGNSNPVAATGAGAVTGGITGVSLRGLGSQRTLVLINGQRVASGGLDSTTVDVGMIPLSALEKVDVLKDSASAVYGSDAIAGVINYTFRDNYQGFELSGYGGGTSDGGGAIKHISGLAGFGNLTADRYNVLFTVDYQKENQLFGRQRDFARSGINVAAGNDVTSGHTFPANFVDVANTFGPVNPGAPNRCGPSVSDPLRSPDTCRFDPGPFVALLPDVDKYNVYTAAHFALSSDVQLYSSISYAQHKLTTEIQPVPLSDAFAIPANSPLATQAPYSCGPGCANATIHLDPSSPYYPTTFVKSITGGATPILDVFYRSFATGNRVNDDVSKQPRLTLGVKGIVSGWDFDAGFLYSQTQLTEHVDSGYPALSKILPLLNSGQVNLFGANTPAVEAQLRATNFVGDAFATRTTIEQFEASGARQTFELPAGPLQMALDASIRKEKFARDPSSSIQTGDISGYGSSFFNEDDQRNVFGAALEFHVPILRSLSASPAVRYDYYQGTGAKTTPKIGLRWKPMDQLLVRGSYGKGFRAPSLTELFLPQTLGVSAPGLSDPLRCPTTSSPTDCNAQFNITFGGNTRLHPETSDTFTLGFVAEPVNDLSIGVDGFSIKLKDTIIFGINQQFILNNLLRYGSLITRGAPTANCPGCPGPITKIDQTNANLGETDVKGFDVDVRYRTPVTPWGRLTFGFVGSYFATYRVQQVDGSFLNEAGRVSLITNGNGGVIPRWHHFATLAWDQGPWELALSHNFQPPYQDLPSTDTNADREVASYSTVDLQASYSGIKHAQIAVGARNLFDRAPPYSNVGGTNYFQEGYDAGYSDPRGRFIYGSVTYSFALGK